MKNLHRALKYFQPDGWRLVLVFALMLVSIGFNVLKPWPLAIIVDSILGNKPLTGVSANFFGNFSPAKLIAVLSFAVFLLHFGQGALQALQNFVAIKIGLRGLTRVRNEVFGHLQQLSLRFHQGANAGDLIFRASWDTYSFQTLFQQGLVTFVTAFVSLLVMIGIMARINLILTLAALATIPLLMGAIKIFGRRMNARTTAAQQADSKVTSLFQQAIAAIQLIQSYTRESREKKRFNEQAIVAEQDRIAQHGSELVYWFGIATVFGIGVAALTWLGANQVLAGKLTIGQLLVFLAYLTQLYEPLNQLSHVGATIASARAGTQRVFEILDTHEEIKEDPNAVAIVPAAAATTKPTDANLPLRGSITFEDISFGYEPSRPVLQNISLALAPGQSAAIIGPSGAGKTTLMNLLPRFFDPAKGAVKIDGIDARKLRLQDLRSSIALVLQEPILLPTTLAENIAYAKPDATTEQIENAARLANAHGFIAKLPNGYQTVVGDGATRLSVGEKQRINLARAFLKDAPILLLDEPTSALDAENEELIIASLQKLMHGRTTLIAAHRLATIRSVDKIFVLENGRLTQAGSPEELKARDGYYARLLATQA